MHVEIEPVFGGSCVKGSYILGSFGIYIRAPTLNPKTKSAVVSASAAVLPWLLLSIDASRGYAVVLVLCLGWAPSGTTRIMFWV